MSPRVCSCIAAFGLLSQDLRSQEPNHASTFGTSTKGVCANEYCGWDVTFDSSRAYICVTMILVQIKFSTEVGLG